MIRLTEKSGIGRIGLVALFVFFFAAVSLSNAMLRGIRLDLTENQLYTLSDGTERVLVSIDEPIDVYFFFSDRATASMPALRSYAGRVREMLQEFVEKSDGKLRVTEIDPLPFSEEEDRANALGLQGISLQGTGDPVYMGIAATNSVGDEELIAFLDPGKEKFLEYDLAKLIATLADPDRPVVGLISGLQMMGGFDPQTGGMQQPWVVMSEIQDLFELRTLSATEGSIDEDIDVLLLVHPKDIDPATLYAIDQFIMRGGHALIAVDPYSELDTPPADPNNPAAAMMADKSSELNTLLEAWGARVGTENVVGDDRYAIRVSGFGAQPVRHIALLGIDDDGIDGSDVTTANVSNINLGFTGYIEQTNDKSGIDLIPLVQSSEFAAPIPAQSLPFVRNPDTLREDFQPTGERYTLAARLNGPAGTAFPDGPPEGYTAGGPDQLTESAEDINVILLADSDLFTDRLWVQVQDFFGQQFATPFAGNGDFIVNALDNLSGSGDLISIRGRETYTRPFTRVQALRRQAEERFRSTERRLQDELRMLEEKLSQLQASRDDDNALILSPEQEAELERFQQERLRIRKELRQVRRELARDIEDLGLWLKIINIGLMPLLVALAGLTLLALRRRRRGA